jgi:hypothetical protein
VFRRRKPRTGVQPDLRRAFEAFRRTLAEVEEAKRALAAAAPGGRTAGVPLADALAAFEEGLGRARASMQEWRRPGVDAAWSACTEALEEAARRAEELRLGETVGGYEQLYGKLADLMDPLDSFGLALDRFSRLGH